MSRIHNLFINPTGEFPGKSIFVTNGRWPMSKLSLHYVYQSHLTIYCRLKYLLSVYLDAPQAFVSLILIFPAHHNFMISIEIALNKLIKDGGVKKISRTRSLKQPHVLVVHLSYNLSLIIFIICAFTNIFPLFSIPHLIIKNNCSRCLN